MVVEYTYDAWGKVLSTTGSMAGTLGTIQPFRYRGYVYDVETGLYYLRSRYYWPIWMRFLNADSVIKDNLYGYCKNEPIKSFDYHGKERIIVGETNAPHVRYRSSPTLDSDSIVSWLPKGTELILKEDSENPGWYKTIVGYNEVYIMADCIDELVNGDTIIWSMVIKSLGRAITALYMFIICKKN